jgi:SpoVK/Ycf46/Vps4 family AAA+-type ATPase
MRFPKNPFRTTDLKIHRRKFKKAASFAMASVEERRAVIDYLLNLIDARIEKNHPEYLFRFCEAVLGPRAVYEMLKPCYPGRLDASDSGDISGWAQRNLTPSDMAVVVRDRLRPAVENVSRRLTGRRDQELSTRLGMIGEVFKLTDEELAFLQLFYLVGNNQVAMQHLGDEPLDITNYSNLRSIGHIVLGLDRRRFLSLLNITNLFDARLIEFEMDGISLDDRISEYLAGVGDRKLKNTFFTREGGTHLKVSDFFISRQDLKVLGTLLRAKAGGNILFYGAPGTGKTSLARSLARHFKLDLYSVRVPERDDDHDLHIRAVYATVNAVKPKGSLILVDEADELLNTAVMPNMRNITNKSWVNNFLDGHDHKIIWITNRSEAIEPSTMRRFAFSYRFDRLTARNRMTVLNYELRKHGLRNRLGDGEIRELAKQYEVDAGGIVNAVNIMKLRQRAGKEEMVELAEAVLRNHQEAMSGRRMAARHRDFRTYSLEGLSTSQDLEKIIEALRDFSGGRVNREVRSLSLMLYGPPGTGKSEFVHYLGSRIGRDITIKRVSDIDGMFVGETENNIAQAFREAQMDGNLLFFDEADSFFYPRKDAVRSWEKKFTNELLAQLDSFQGIVVFATNDIGGLDHAALRRFKFKVKFNTLSPNGVLHFYNLLLMPLADPDAMMSPGDRSLLQAMRNLTPGDFAVVREQFLFENRRPEHRELLASLEREAGHKRDRRTITGFGPEMAM